MAQVDFYSRRNLRPIGDNLIRDEERKAANKRQVLRLRLYCNGDRFFKGKKVCLDPRSYNSFTEFMNHLTSHMPPDINLPNGVRQIYTPRNGNRVVNMEGLRDGMECVLAGNETFKPIKYGTQALEPWGKGSTAQASQAYGYRFGGRLGPQLAGADDSQYAGYNAFPPSRYYRQVRSNRYPYFHPVPTTNRYKILRGVDTDASTQQTVTKPRVITVVQSGPRSPRKVIKVLLNRRSVQPYEQLVRDISEQFGTPTEPPPMASAPKQPDTRIYTVRGREVQGISDFFREDDMFIWVGGETHRPNLGLPEVADILRDIFPDKEWQVRTLMKEWERRHRRAERLRRKQEHHQHPQTKRTSLKLESHPPTNSMVSLQLASSEDDKRDSGFDESEPHVHSLDEEGRSTYRGLQTDLPPLRTESEQRPDLARRRTSDEERRRHGLPLLRQNGAARDIRRQLQQDKFERRALRRQQAQEIEKKRQKQQKQAEEEQHEAEVKIRQRRREMKEARERELKEAKEREEREIIEREAREAREAKEREARERNAREAREQEIREMRERETRETREREAREMREREAREMREREAREMREREAREMREREAREAREREAMTAREQEEKEKEARINEEREEEEKAAEVEEEQVTSENQNAVNDDVEMEGQAALTSRSTVTSQTSEKDETPPDHEHLPTVEEESQIIEEEERKNKKEAFAAAEAAARKRAAEAEVKLKEDEDKKREEPEKKKQEHVSARPEEEKENKKVEEKKVRSRKPAGGKIMRQYSRAEHVLDKYDMGKVMGDGNFAIVRACRKRESGNEYAIKIIDKSKLRGRENMIANEIDIMRACSHSNIVKLREEYETPAEIFLVMELVKGGDLFDAITQSVKFSEPQASSMVNDLTQALFYLHSRMIVHRDLKPENLLVVRNKNGSLSLKLADFGLAMEVRRLIYTVCGTPTYVAPEILEEKGYGLEVDLWALGVITYILLCGFPPFRSPERKQTELFELIKSGRFEFLSPYWDNISSSAKDLISHLLVVDRKRRYTAIDVLSHPWVMSVAGSLRIKKPLDETRQAIRADLEARARADLEEFRALRLNNA